MAIRKVRWPEMAQIAGYNIKKSFRSILTSERYHLQSPVDRSVIESVLYSSKER